MGKDQETYAQHAVDLRVQVLEVHICEIFNLELHAGGNDDLLGVVVDVQDAKTLLQLLNLGLFIAGIGLLFHQLSFV
jgi:hypothetical protein